MVKRTGSFVKASRVPGIRKSEFLKIEMMAELVTKRAEKNSERCDFLSHRRSRPDADQHGIGAVVSEQFAGPAFANPQGARRENTNPWGTA